MSVRERAGKGECPHVNSGSTVCMGPCRRTPQPYFSHGHSHLQSVTEEGSKVEVRDGRNVKFVMEKQRGACARTGASQGDGNAQEYRQSCSRFQRRRWNAADKAEITSSPLPHRPSPSCQFGDCFLLAVAQLGRTTLAIQPRQLIYADSNLKKNNRQTDMNEWSGHSVRWLVELPPEKLDRKLNWNDAAIDELTRFLSCAVTDEVGNNCTGDALFAPCRCSSAP